MTDESVCAQPEGEEGACCVGCSAMLSALQGLWLAIG